MSLASTSTLKAQLKASLGPNSDRYFSVLSQFICGLLSRVEFEEAVRQHLTTQHLLQLHNALVISLFDASSHQRPRSPPPGSPTRHQRKRLRIWPYQGPGENEGPRSSRLKRWVVGVGRKERDRTRSLQNAPSVSVRLERGEIARERAVVVLPERGEPSGSRLPLTLSTMSRSLNIQHIFDRMNLISAQWNLGTPQKNVAPLLLLALEAKLKQLITHACTLTYSSPAISSITTSVPHTQSTLSPSSFDTLFTISPAILPNQSAAAMRLLGEGRTRDREDLEAEMIRR